jgi:DNA-binding NtrC family response regulator
MLHVVGKDKKMAKILLVDDHPYIRTLISSELNEDGFCVVQSATIELMWECIRETRLDLVLINMDLEQWDSWQVYYDICKEEPGLPVLIFTLKSQDAMRRLKQAVTQVLSERRFFRYVPTIRLNTRISLSEM